MVTMVAEAAGVAVTYCHSGGIHATVIGASMVVAIEVNDPRDPRRACTHIAIIPAAAVEEAHGAVTGVGCATAAIVSTHGSSCKVTNVVAVVAAVALIAEAHIDVPGAGRATATITNTRSYSCMVTKDAAVVPAFTVVVEAHVDSPGAGCTPAAIANIRSTSRMVPKDIAINIGSTTEGIVTHAGVRGADCTPAVSPTCFSSCCHRTGAAAVVDDPRSAPGAMVVAPVPAARSRHSRVGACGIVAGETTP